MKRNRRPRAPALTPPELVKAHVNLDDATASAVTTNKGKPITIR